MGYGPFEALCKGRRITDWAISGWRWFSSASVKLEELYAAVGRENLHVVRGNVD